MNATIRLRALVLPLALALVFLLLLAQQVHAGGTAVPTDSYRVVSGDTLWDLADDRTEPGGDVRSVVRTIQRLNDLDGALIIPGQLILVPAAFPSP
jgi:nucleoid-associated protein YgaU